MHYIQTQFPRHALHSVGQYIKYKYLKYLAHLKYRKLYVLGI